MVSEAVFELVMTTGSTLSIPLYGGDFESEESGQGESDGIVVQGGFGTLRGEEKGKGCGLRAYESPPGGRGRGKHRGQARGLEKT